MKKIIINVFALVTLLVFSGCSTTITAVGNYTGYGFDGTMHELGTADFEISEKDEVVFDKNKAYVVNNNARILLEDVNGKVTLVGYAKQYGSSFQREVEEGEHTYVGFGACGPYRVTINAKKGYIYPIRGGATTAPLMAWCRGVQEVFKKDTRIKSSKQRFFNNNSIVERNRSKIDEIIDSSSYQRRYDSFKEDVDDVNPERNLYINSDEGLVIE